MAEEDKKLNQTPDAPEDTQPQDAPQEEPKQDEPKAKKTTKKAKKIDVELQSRSTGATGYRAFYHQMLKGKK